MFVAVKVIFPATVGVMVNVWAVAELEKVRIFVVNPELPVPDGVTVIVPVYKLLGVTMKLAEVLFTLPDVGPVKVYEVTTAGAFGITEFEGAEATEVPAALVALTVKV